MELIKIAQDHYIIVDDSEIKVGDYCTTHLNIIDVGKIHNSYTIFNPKNQENLDMLKSCKKITHSTQPLEWFGGKIIFLSEVKELIGEVDVEKKAEKFIGCEYEDIEDNIDQIGYDSFIRGYNQALEDNKEKKWTDEDLMKAIEFGYQLRCNNRPINSGHNWVKDFIAQFLQPKTEWEVEFVDGKLTLKK